MSTRIILIPAFSLPLFPSHLPFFLTFSKEGRSREFVQLSTRFQTRRDFSRLFPFEGKYAFSLQFLARFLPLVSWIKKGGGERKKRETLQLFVSAKSLRDFCREGLLFGSYWKNGVDDGRFEEVVRKCQFFVTLWVISRDCGSMFSNNYLLVP